MTIVQDFIPIGPARKGIDLDCVTAIVVHWPAAPNQTAQQTTAFWKGPENKAGDSAHAVISEDGTIIQTVPWHEVAYHVGSSLIDPASGKIYTDLARTLFGPYASNPKTTSPNHCTIGIEMETVDWLGTYTPETVQAAIELCAQLCKDYMLDPLTRIIRHYDVVGWKHCPKWYVDNPTDFDLFKREVQQKVPQ